MAVAGHLTCVGATQQQVGKVIDDCIAAGVRHIVALRGGAPDGSTGGSVAGGYRDAADLLLVSAGSPNAVAPQSHIGYMSSSPSSKMRPKSTR